MRVIIRRIRADDADAYYNFALSLEDNEHVSSDKKITRENVAQRVKVLSELVRDDCFYWAIDLQGFVGILSLEKFNDKFYAGIALHPDYWGKGVSDSAFNELFNFSKSKNLKKIYAEVESNNTHSIGFLKRIGFEYYMEKERFDHPQAKDKQVGSVFEYIKNLEDCVSNS